MERTEIESKYKWNLSHIYNNNEEWVKDKQKIESEINKISSFKGKLNESSSTLYSALESLFNIKKELIKLYGYAHMNYDQDTRNSEALGMQQEASQLFVEFSSASAYITPEILNIPENIIKEFIVKEDNLSDYVQFINNIVRTKSHTLSEAEESIVAQAGIMSDSASNIYDIFTNADIPKEETTLSNGQKVSLDHATFNAHRSSLVREDRRKVFETYFDSIDRFKRTIGTQLYSQLKRNLFYKGVRKYDSCLDAALNEDNIPVSVYKKLISNANNNLPTLHRYLKLRKRMLDLDKMHYYDMYPPLVKSSEKKYGFEEAEKLVLNSVEVLGKDYCDIVEKSFREGWIDVLPNEGKQSGAYSQGSIYDVHPYILLNYNGKYDDVSTLTHELGHTMHSYLSNKNQKYVNSDYPIFLAEVASTVNEALLIDYVLKNTTDKDERLSLLGSYLEGFRTTLFRQTQFAEFELKINEVAESGESLTGDSFNKIYLDILKRYYGHEEGVTEIEDIYSAEWAMIPHFYYNFYVFQYSTSFAASQAISEKILTEGEPMVKKYLEFLSSGCSEYAIPTLEKIGVDMNSDTPFNLTIQKMNEIMDEIEKLL